MRKNSFYIGTGVLGMWLFAACSQDGVPDNGASGSAEMRIYTDVAHTYKRPNEPYNTDELYPDGNRRVMATGYAPALTPEKRTDNTDNYERLTIPKDGLCKTDVLTSITPVVALAALPFDREDGETLQFMHAQSRVYFYAKLAEGSKEFLKNVRIKLSPTVVATQVEWKRDKSLYVPIASGQESYELAQQPNEISKETGRQRKTKGKTPIHSMPTSHTSSPLFLAKKASN